MAAWNQPPPGEDGRPGDGHRPLLTARWGRGVGVRPRLRRQREGGRGAGGRPAHPRLLADPRRLGRLLVERLPIPDAAAQELRPVGHGDAGTAGSGSSDHRPGWCQHRSFPLASRCARMAARSRFTSSMSCARDSCSRSSSIICLAVTGPHGRPFSAPGSSCWRAADSAWLRIDVAGSDPSARATIPAQRPRRSRARPRGDSR